MLCIKNAQQQVPSSSAFTTTQSKLNMFFRNWHWKLATKLIVCGAAFFGTNTAITPWGMGRAFAQEVVPDNTLPQNSVVDNLPNNVTEITGGTQAGGNLFHSFERFGVSTGSEVHFNNALDINNIINRVTGGNISNINGLIRANGTANFFLINPAGIVFGENARLDIGGSFIGSTADALGFGEDNFFSATDPQNSSSLLSINPNALFFNRINTASIQNNSLAESGRNPTDDFTARGLRVRDGNSLLLVGGDINIDAGEPFGGLYAFGGRIELGGLRGVGTVGLNSDGNNFSLSFPSGVEKSNVTLSNQARVNVRAGDGGSIAVNARKLEMTGESWILAGIDTGLGDDGSKAGNIDINLTDAIDLNDSWITNDVGSQANGQGGDVNINTNTLLVQNGARVSADTRGEGKGGNLTVDAQSIELIRGDGDSTGLFARARSNSTGDAGNLTINTNSLLVQNGAQVSASTFGEGNGGNLTVNAQDIQLIRGEAGVTGLFARASSGSTGDAGNLTINTNSLQVENGAVVSASTFAQGKGGNLSIDATDIKLIGGEAGVTGLFTSAEKDSTGDARDLTINTNSLLVQNGAQVSASTFGEGNGGNLTVNATDIKLTRGDAGVTGLFARADNGSTGDGGDLTINTNTLRVENGAVVSAGTFAQGNGGNLTIDAQEKVEVIGESSNGVDSGLYAQANSGSTGNAGNLKLKTNSLLVQNGAEVSASTFGEGKGGNLTVDAQSIELIRGDADSTGLYARANSGSKGDGGDLTIDTNTLLVKDGAQVSASTFDEGRGGNLTVDAQDIQLIGRTVDGEFASGLYARANSDSTGNAGDLTVKTNSLRVEDGAQVSTSTSSNSKGDAGNLIIKTNSLLVKDGGFVNASTRGTGKGGNLTVNATDIQLTRGEAGTTGLFAQAIESTGDGGDLTINTNTLRVENGAVVSAGTFDEGRGGNLTVNAQDIQLIGRTADGEFPSGLFAQANSDSTGDAGNLKITTDILKVEDGARVSVQNLNRGNAGNLTIDAESIRLNNDAELIADTRSNKVDPEGEQATINIKSRDLILRNGSNITADARNSNVTGGNINIDSGVIAAFENSDITANSKEGRGGNIKIETQGIFGTQVREKRTSQSDITAAGANELLRGTIEINGIVQNPAEVLAELPSVPLESRFNDVCEASYGPDPSEFYIIGNGGVPLSPWDYLRDESIYVDWVPIPEVTRKVTRGQGDKVTRGQSDKKTRGRVLSENRIVEATGWIVDKNGDIYFVADASEGTPPSFNNPSCLKKS